MTINLTGSVNRSQTTTLSIASYWRRQSYCNDDNYRYYDRNGSHKILWLLFLPLLSSFNVSWFTGFFTRDTWVGMAINRNVLLNPIASFLYFGFFFQSSVYSSLKMVTIFILNLSLFFSISIIISCLLQYCCIIIL